MKPAAFVIKKFGGVRACARAVGRSPSSVSRWNKPRKSGKGRGMIPLHAHKNILKAAKKLRIKLQWKDLIFDQER